MNYLYLLFFGMLSIFLSYIGFIWIRYGIQRSISDSYYILPKKVKFLFTIFCWGFALPAIIIGSILTDNLLMFLAGSGIIFVGAAAEFKEKLEKIVHMVAAYGGVAFSQLSIGYDFKMYYVNIIFLLIALILQFMPNKYIKNPIWWQEILAFIAICYVFAISLFFL